MGVLSSVGPCTAVTVPCTAVQGDIASGPSRSPDWGEPLGLRINTDDDVLLEAELVSVPDPIAAVVLAHPHPAHGGSMRSLVTSELFSALPGMGLSVLRFNFRGVEGSGGTHSGGEPERHDVVAAVHTLAGRVPGVPLVVSGWSFGADVSLAVDDDAIDGWFAIAPPLRVIDPALWAAATDARPKVLAVPEHDQFNPPEACADKTSHWTNTTMRTVGGGDHFLVGRTRIVARWLADFAGDPAAQAPQPGDTP